ncbi:MAG: hypothetical protein ACI9E1_002224 [Cryomorphaceae bacterium]|jgi:hypothetical protein
MVPCGASSSEPFQYQENTITITDKGDLMRPNYADQSAETILIRAVNPVHKLTDQSSEILLLGDS